MKTHLGHYEIESELGRGGMGVVYRAFEPALNRYVAIKELSPSLAHDPQLVERFLREARSMAALSDPHIIQIFYIGTDETTSQPFFAMEYVEGDSLSGILKRDGKIDVENTLKILHQTAQGLATAHDRGVIHRDIKPGNLMLSARGQVKIADFGIALAAQDISNKLTSTGEFVGTPGYLSPEVCLGKAIDQRSDIFSLGIVMFEMLSGHTPFSDESPLGLMLEVVKADMPDIQHLNDKVDAQTAAILARMVAKNPEDRFQSCHDLAAALEAHPLVARGGAIKLAKPAQTANAATVVGAATPKSSPRQVTPPPVVRSGTGSNAGPAAGSGSVAIDSVPTRATNPEQRPAPKRSSLWVPLAIAATLVLFVAGGAFAFRGQVMDFVRGFGDGFVGRSEVAYESGRNTGMASNPVGVSVAAESANRAAGEDNLDDHTSSIEIDSARPSMSQAAINEAMEQDRSSPDSSGLEIAMAPVATLSETPAASANPTVSIASTTSAATDATAAPVSTAKTQQVATTTPRPAPAPTPQRVAVITSGDSAITGPARSHIERQLNAAGFDLVNAEALGVDGSDLSSALNALRRSATVALVIRAEPVGSEQLQYYGRVSESYVANLSVRAYKTSDRTSIGTDLHEKVQFTTHNADAQTKTALSGKLDRLITELSPYRRRG